MIEKVEIDLTGKQAGDTIRVADLPIATTEGIHLKTNPEETVVQVTEVHNEVPEDEETETDGGIIYGLKLPIFDKLPKDFGSHEIFHLFVMGGSICHFIFMYAYLM